MGFHHTTHRPLQEYTELMWAWSGDADSMKLDRGLLLPKDANRVLAKLFGKLGLPEASQAVALFLQLDGKDFVAGMLRFDQWGAFMPTTRIRRRPHRHPLQ